MSIRLVTDKEGGPAKYHITGKSSDGGQVLIRIPQANAEGPLSVKGLQALHHRLEKIQPDIEANLKQIRSMLSTFQQEAGIPFHKEKEPETDTTR